jgi:hypothetical protein
MEYVFGVSTVWFAIITIFTLFGIAKYKTTAPFDVFIGMIISPALAFASAAFFVWSMQ